MKPLFVRLGLKSQQYHDGMRKARDDTKRLKKNTDQLSLSTDQLSLSFKSMKRIAIASFAGIGISKVIINLKEAIKVASDLQEVTSKFNTVFKHQEEIANKWAKGLVDSYAMSTREAKQFLASLQDLFVPMGMDAQAAAKLSNEVVKLAADLGSFNNMPTEDVMMNIQSALVGNYVPMKKYGVVLNENTVKQKAFNMGLYEGKGHLDAVTKALAAYEIMVESSSAAIGDMERTANSYANVSKKLNATWEDFSATLGNIFIPTATYALKSLIKIIDELDRASLSINKFIDSMKEGQGLEYYDKQISNLTRQIINLKTAAEEAPKSFTDYWYKIVGEPSNIERTIAALEKQRAELEKQRDVYKSIGTFRQKITNIPPPTILSEKDAGAVDNALAKWFADLEKIDDQYYKIQEVSEQSIQEFHIDEALGKWFSGLDNIEDQYYQIEAAQESLKEFSIDKSLDEWFKGLDEIEDQYYQIEASEQSIQEFHIDEVLEEWFKDLDKIEEQYYQIKIAQESLKEFSIDRSLDEWFKGLDESEKKAEENAKEIESIYETFLRNIQNSFADVFEDIFSGQVKSWEDYLDTVKKMFIRMLAEMAAAALTKKITAYVTTEQQPGSSGANIGYFGGTSGAGGVWTGALAGTAVGSQQQSPLGGAVSGALAGYAMGGGYGAIAGAILGAIAANQSNDQSAAYTYEMGENWVSGFFGDIYNQGMFIPQYGYAGKHPKGGTIGGEQIQNQLVDAANEIIQQYQQILQTVPENLAQQMQDAIAGVSVQWSGSYEMSPAQVIQYFTDQYNQTLMGEIGPMLQEYVTGSEAYGLLSEYTQSEILAPFYTAPGEVAPFASAEEALAALQYLEQVQKAWQDISLTSQGLAGDSIAYEQGINNINNAFDQMIDSLQQLGIATEKIDEIESQRQEALAYYAEQMQKQVNNILDQWHILSGSMTEYEQQLMELAKQYEAAQQAMIDAGASQAELNELEQQYEQAIADVNKQMQKQIKDTLSQWNILAGNVNKYEQQLIELASQYEASLQSMIDAGATQAELNELEVLYRQAVGNVYAQQAEEMMDAWNRFYANMMGDLAPSQSAEFMGYQLTQMLATGSQEEIMNFITSEYLPYMQQYGSGDYNELWSTIMSLMENMQNMQLMANMQLGTGILQPEIPESFAITNPINPGAYQFTGNETGSNQTKIIIQIGNNTVDQFILESLKNDNSEIVREIRRIAAV